METLCNKEFLGTSSITALMREMELVLGLCRAYFFGPEVSKKASEVCRCSTNLGKQNAAFELEILCVQLQLS